MNNNYHHLLFSLAFLGLAVCACTGNATTTPTESTSTLEMPTSTAIPEIHADMVFNNIGFDHDDSLAICILPEIVPSNPNDERMPMPSYSLFAFQKKENQKFFTDTIKIFEIDELSAVNPQAGRVADNLISYLESGDIPENGIPSMNLGVRQLFTAQISQLEFRNGRGVRFLSQFGNGLPPVNNEDLVYIFQGITTDGRYYISMRYGVQHADLLTSSRDLPTDYPDVDSFIRDYQNYLNRMEDELNSKPVMSFSPDLTLLDSLVQSLIVLPN